MEKLLKPLLFVGLGLLVGYGISKLAAPTTSTCCQNAQTCDIPAPASVEASFQQTTLNVSWATVQGASKYVVNVYDINDSLQPVTPSRVVEGNNVAINATEFNPGHEFEIAVTALCEGCVPSSHTARTATCYIVIDDICKFGVVCDLCTCNGFVGTSFSGSDVVFSFGGTGHEMYKVTIQKGPSDPRSSFVFQTHKPTAYRYVCLKTEADDTACESNVENPPRPISGGCGTMDEPTLKYEVQITETQCIIKKIPAGYTVTVKRCTCP